MADRQYSLSVAQYAGDTMLNLATSRVAIASIYTQNAVALAEQAARSVDTIAQRTLMGNYMGGNTIVTTTLGSAGTTITVNDITGFQYRLNSAGQPVAVSSSFPLAVTINGTAYSVTGATADGTNVSTSPMGISGTLTTSANVTTTDGTQGHAVISGVAPAILRPAGVTATNLINPATANTNNGQLTAGMVLAAKAQLAANNVPPAADGTYWGCFDPIQLIGLYNDTMFQNFFRGGNATPEYRRGKVAELLGVTLMETNLNPVQTGATVVGGTGTIRRGIIAGKGALIEAQFTRSAYAEVNQVSDDPLITVVDGIAHITREPIDALKQVVTQAWSYIGGFTVPTDTTASPTTLPTASNAAYKRAVVVESQLRRGFNERQSVD